MIILLGNQKITYKPLPPSAAECSEIALAARVAEFLWGRLEGSEQNPASWAGLAAELGCRVYQYHAPGAGLGEYATTLSNSGVITYNTAATRWMQVATLVHEMAHHVLVLWGIVPPTTVALVCRSETDSLSHRVARRVEATITRWI